MLLLIFDYFLYVTGNPSIIYTFIGGFFFLYFFIAPVISYMFCAKVIRDGYGKLPVYTHVGSIIVFSAVTFLLSDEARNYAVNNFDALTHKIFDRKSTNIIISDDDLTLLDEIRNKSFELERDGFVPTIRRMDYIVKSEHEKSYRIIVQIKWNNTPIVIINPVTKKQRESMGQ